RALSAKDVLRGTLSEVRLDQLHALRRPRPSALVDAQHFMSIEHETLRDEPTETPRDARHDNLQRHRYSALPTSMRSMIRSLTWSTNPLIVASSSCPDPSKQRGLPKRIMMRVGRGKANR